MNSFEWTRSLSRPLREVEGELRVVVSPVDHPECVAWFEGEVYFGTEGGALLASDPSTGGVRIVAETDGSLLGIALDGAGNCYACDRGRGLLLRISPDGQEEVLADSVEGRRLVTPNFPLLDSHGSLWVTESGSGFRSGDGYLFRLRPGGEPERVDDSCRHYPNGLALSRDGKELHVVESAWPGMVSYPFVDGDIGARSETIHLPRSVPDGLAVDADDRLYISCWRPDGVLRLDPRGEEVRVLVEDWTAEFLATPTNICFGGADLRTLFLASYSGWSITALDMTDPGVELHHPTGPHRDLDRAPSDRLSS
jgi:gluconolactonase